MKPLRRSLVTLFALLLFSCQEARAQEALPQDRSSAVIFAYYRVGEDQFPGTNIRLDQFQSHVRELKDGRYNVLSLPDMITALQGGATLPDRAVVLTFDGG